MNTNPRMRTSLPKRFRQRVWLLIPLLLFSCKENQTFQTKEQHTSSQESVQSLEKPPAEKPWPYNCIQAESSKTILPVGQFEQEAIMTSAPNPIFGGGGPTPERISGVRINFKVNNTTEASQTIRVNINGTSERENRNAESGSLSWGGKSVTASEEYVVRPGMNSLSIRVDTMSEVESSGAGGTIGRAFGALLTGSYSAASMLESTFSYSILENQDDFKAFQAAKTANTLEAFRAYLVPGKPLDYRNEAVAAVEGIREAAFFREMCYLPCVASIQTYLQRCSELAELKKNAFAHSRMRRFDRLQEFIKVVKGSRDWESSYGELIQLYSRLDSPDDVEPRVIKEILHAEIADLLPVMDQLSWVPYPDFSIPELTDKFDYDLVLILDALKQARARYLDQFKRRYTELHPDPNLSDFQQQSEKPVWVSPLLQSKPRGEFESTSDYEDRVRREKEAHAQLVVQKKAEHEKSLELFEEEKSRAEQKLAEAKELRAERLRPLESWVAQIESNSLIKEALRITLKEAAIKVEFGRYDADKEVFPATITSSRYAISATDIPLSVPKSAGPSFKKSRDEGKPVSVGFAVEGEKDDPIRILPNSVIYDVEAGKGYEFLTASALLPATITLDSKLVEKVQRFVEERGAEREKRAQAERRMNELFLASGWIKLNPYVDGLSRARQSNDSSWVFLNKSGDVALSPESCNTGDQWLECGDFSEGYAWIKPDNGEPYYIDKQGGKLRLKMKEERDKVLYLTNYSEGLAAAKIRDYYGNNMFHDKFVYINTSGEIVLGSDKYFTYLSPVINGVAYAIDSIAYRKSWVKIDAKGNILRKFDGEPEEMDAHMIRKPQIGESSLSMFKDENQMWGFKDNSQNVLLPAKWSLVSEFVDGRAMVSKNGRWAFIDERGNIIGLR